MHMLDSETVYARSGRTSAAIANRERAETRGRIGTAMPRLTDSTMRLAEGSRAIRENPTALDKIAPPQSVSGIVGPRWRSPHAMRVRRTAEPDILIAGCRQARSRRTALRCTAPRVLRSISACSIGMTNAVHRAANRIAQAESSNSPRCFRRRFDLIEATGVLILAIRCALAGALQCSSGRLMRLGLYREFAREASGSASSSRSGVSGKARDIRPVADLISAQIRVSGPLFSRRIL